VKVLLPLDGGPCSATAIDAVLSQFRPEATDVRVLHVVEWPKGLPMHLALGEGPTAGADVLASRDRAFRDGEAVVSRAAQRLHEAGFTTSQVVVAGEARETIIADAAAWRPDLIVIGSHGWKGLERVLLGSVSDAVVRRAPCSVEVVRGSPPA
jgi:nucleotide-binding universal stress UspA family protein